jgi:putative NADH-flavin reductase
VRVTVLGATGRVGQHVLRSALAAGHQPVILTRSTPSAPDPRVEVVIGTVTDDEAVRRAIAGSEAVIAALGPRSNSIEDEVALEAGMRNVVEAMAGAGVRRLVALSGAGIDVPGDRKPAIDRVVSRFVRLAARHVVGAKQREFEVFSASDLVWTAVRPAIVTDGPPRGYRLSLELRPGARTTRADVAEAMVDQLADDTFIGQAPFVLPASSGGR